MPTVQKLVDRLAEAGVETVGQFLMWREAIMKENIVPSLSLGLAGVHISQAKGQRKNKGAERQDKKNPRLLAAQVWADEMLTIEFLIYFAIVELVGMTVKETFDGLQMRGLTVWSMMQKCGTGRGGSFFCSKATSM
ncbi:hypothetical protein FACS189472_15450 [Alphaproteobacteria bacterium]|nr:hypothetical protein FACS189472_15450 [Alphaproteobacteria bacterium]